jgi:hypothetical protein
MARDSEGAGQSKRPPLSHYVSHDSDSQASDHTSSQSTHHRPKPHKQHVVGAGRLYSRVPSTKALQHKPHHHHTKASNTTSTNRRHPSPSPERPPERPPMLSAAHRRTTSDVRLSRDTSASNLRKNTSHSNLHLKRNRSHVEVGKRSRPAASAAAVAAAAAAVAPRRSSSHKDVTRLKGAKGTVHFDLGTDGNDEVDADAHDDEWVDASASASPYLSRRGSAASSSAQAPGKPDERADSADNPNITPSDAQDTPDNPDRERVQHKEYLTSRLLRRTPSQGAPPKMTTDTAVVPARSVSPDSGLSRASSTLYESPRTAHVLPTTVGSSNNNADELTSRFVSGPGSGVNPETGSFYSPTNTVARVKRPKSMGSLHRENRHSMTDDPDDEDESALAPRSRGSTYKAAPAEKSRTQQKLNLQRASSTIEPVPAGGGVGAVGASPLLGGAAYDNRDPRIGKLIERTGQEYLVVRRHQNPIARSIARLQRLPGADRNQHISKTNGANGSVHSKKSSELNSAARYGLSPSLGDAHRSQPQAPRREGSVRTNGASPNYEADDDRVHLSGASYVGGEDEGVAALLRNLWDKSMELSASQD